MKTTMINFLVDIWRVIEVILMLAWALSFFGIIGIFVIIFDPKIPSILCLPIILFNIWWLIYYFTNRIKNPVNYFILG